MKPFLAVAEDARWATLAKAAAFRRASQARPVRLSYVDAVGYVLAAELRLPFLTGDPAFKGVPGVEFLPASRRPPKKGS
jgi:hypothetical protein